MLSEGASFGWRPFSLPARSLSFFVEKIFAAQKIIRGHDTRCTFGIIFEKCREVTCLRGKFALVRMERAAGYADKIDFFLRARTPEVCLRRKRLTRIGFQKLGKEKRFE